MRRKVCVGIAIVLAVLLVAKPANASKGKGKGRGRGGQSRRPTLVRSPRGKRPTSRFSAPKKQDLSHKDKLLSERRGATQRLQKRLDVANRLEKISEHNGNRRLRDTADRMRVSAQKQYRQQLDRLGEPAGAELEPLPERITGRENALRRQLENAQRQLDKRLEGANKLYELAEASNDATLLEAAERLEQQAAQRFQDRMEAIQRFSKRHNLNTVKQP